MKAEWLIAIDDTDNLDSVGTGKLARWLAEALEAGGLIEGPSTTRHQLLVHPDIPYTSHNSSACTRASGAPDAGEKILDAARSFLVEHFHDGANPGLCVCRADEVPTPLVRIAWRAQREVLALADFDATIADMHALGVWSSGPTGQGRLGACAGVALRSTGEDGRFIGLAGIRDLDGVLPVRDILSRSGVEAVETEDGRALLDGERVDTRGWVRPNLRGGRAVFRVREGEDGRFVPAERRSKDD
jgi:hypothetical protein